MHLIAKAKKNTHFVFVIGVDFNLNLCSASSTGIETLAFTTLTTTNNRGFEREAKRRVNVTVESYHDTYEIIEWKEYWK